MSQPINFQELPTSAPNALPPAGVYGYRIVNAKMRQGSSSEYLEVEAELYDKEGHKVYKLYDRIFDSPNNIPRYKLSRFIKALQLPIVGDFYLKDLTKIIIGKEIYADVTVSKDKTGQYPDRLEVNAFSDMVYYSRKEYMLMHAAEHDPEIDEVFPDESGNAGAAESASNRTDSGDDEY